MTLLYFVPLILVIALIIGWFFYDGSSRKKQIVLLSKLDTLAIVDKQKKLKDDSSSDNLTIRLIQAGITKKEYHEGRLVFTVMGLFLGIALPIFFSLEVGLIGIAIGVICVLFGGRIYLAISKAERTEKINNDLGTFLNLVNVILEAGGGLKNAFFQVSRKANGIIDEELLKEIAILEYEMTNYSTKKAYENLKKRVDSEDMSKIIDFLILSEETGIGVKNIFATQSEEMRQEKFYKIKGKVSTLNLYLMLVIFVFVLPSVAAFILFPMMAGKLDMSM